MKLNLKKPLVVFDLETTGLDMVKDRIIQMSYIKVMPDGSESRKNLYVNPGMPIPEEVVALTGISDEDVKNAPTFKQLAANLQKEFEGCDFAGYNSNRFDVPMLAEEFLRAGIDFDFSKCRLIDAQTIFMKMERRNLAAAYKFYCGRKMEEDFEAQSCRPGHRSYLPSAHGRAGQVCSRSTGRTRACAQQRHGRVGQVLHAERQRRLCRPHHLAGAERCSGQRAYRRTGKSTQA